MIEYKLPELTEGQSWSCGNGCGECEPIPSEFEYSRIETVGGLLIESKTERVFLSDCCNAELFLWDEKIGNGSEVEFELIKVEE